MPFKQISKLMIICLVIASTFLLNHFSLSKPGTGLSNTKYPGELVFGNIVDYKKICCLHLGEYLQVHQEDEIWNTIDIELTVVSIILGP